jgi:NAD(P)-dependent dehydrogenase (short-subunit alcohol dehydrogenase family)
MSHWLLTIILLPILQETSRNHGESRVVILSSDGHERVVPNTGIQFDDLTMESFNTAYRYGHSKLGNILHAKALHKRYGPKSETLNPGEIIVAVVHPGLVDT